MDEDKHRCVAVKRSSDVDILSILPESLLCKVLLNLPTKDVVRTSVLSKRWRNLWKYVPGLELDEDIFPDYETFVSFVDAFLVFNSESYLESFKLNYNRNVDYYECPVNRWINIAVDRRVKYLVLGDDYIFYGSDIQLLPTLYTCESLVSLKLTGVKLASPKFVSLPSLKFMDLTIVHFASALDLETLISHCPILEDLFIERSCYDDIQSLRVCSQSLLSFTHVSDRSEGLVKDLVVTITAPRLQYLRLDDCFDISFILNNTSSLVEVYIDTIYNVINFDPNDLQKRKMICNFLEGISCVKDLIIASTTLEVIYHYSKCEQLPIFRSLSFLRVRFDNYKWETLLMFLESCPNLKSLAVALTTSPGKEGISIMSGPRCLLSSLEYVDIGRPVKGEAREMELLSYFLQSSASLKKLTVRLDASMKTKNESAILKQLLTIPRLSTSCQVVVL